LIQAGSENITKCGHCLFSFECAVGAPATRVNVFPSA
jgi:hypothetical protein